MADLTLKKISIRNWATIPQADIEFPEYGLVLVLGNSLVAEGHLEGVGAGKTNFGTAIARTIVGVPDLQIVKFSRHRKGNTYVRVEASLKDQPLLVESGYRCAELSKTGEGARFVLGDSDPVSRSHFNLTREELSNTIGLLPDLARWTVWVDGERLRFDDLPQKDAIELLMMSLRQPSWSQLGAKSSKVLDHFKGEAERAELKLESTKLSVTELEAEVNDVELEVRKAEQAYQHQANQGEAIAVQLESELKAIHQKMEQADRIQKAIASRIKKIEEATAVRYQALESSRLEVDGQLRLKKEDVQKFYRSYVNKQSTRSNEEKPLKRPKVCPTCEREWVHDEDHIARVKERVEQAKIEEATAQRKLQESQQHEGDLQRKLDTIEDDLRKLNTNAVVRRLSGRHQHVEEKADELARDAHGLERRIEQLRRPLDKSAIVAAKTRKALNLEELEKARNQVEIQASEVAELSASVSVIKYWHASFGPTGVSNMVLREVIEPLNDIARRMSQILTGGMIGVSFGTERQLASGEGKDELVVRVQNVLGSSDLEMSSKGERCLSNLIIAETLAELSQTHQTIGFAWYDEVVNNLPTHVRSVVLRYLREKAERNRQLIMIVDHYPESANFADYVLLAEKTQAGTSLRWQ